MSCCVDSLFPTQIHLRSCHPAILQPELNLYHLNADFFYFSFFFFLAVPTQACGILLSQPSIEPVPPAWSPN